MAKVKTLDRFSALCCWSAPYSTPMNRFPSVAVETNSTIRRGSLMHSL